MKKDKRSAAEYLFDELGLIDEKIIAEAEAFRPARTGRGRYIAAIAAAAALFLVVCNLIPVLILNGGKSNQGEDTDRPATLGGVLLESKDSGAYGRESPEEINLFDGRAKLIWQYDGEEEYCVAAISEGECGVLLNQLGAGDRVGDTTGDAGVSFWIAPGDGSVLTPYLKKSDGNIGVGSLFDYSPELEPTEKFAQNVFEYLRH